jgi:hypothetical protein
MKILEISPSKHWLLEADKFSKVQSTRRFRSRSKRRQLIAFGYEQKRWDPFAWRASVLQCFALGGSQPFVNYTQLNDNTQLNIYQPPSISISACWEMHEKNEKNAEFQMANLTNFDVPTRVSGPDPLSISSPLSLWCMNIDCMHKQWHLLAIIFNDL